MENSEGKNKIKKQSSRDHGLCWSLARSKFAQSSLTFMFITSFKLIIITIIFAKEVNSCGPNEEKEGQTKSTII